MAYCESRPNKPMVQEVMGMTLLNRWERWDPFAELNSLQSQMDRLFRDNFQFQRYNPVWLCSFTIFI